MIGRRSERRAVTFGLDWLAQNFDIKEYAAQVSGQQVRVGIWKKTARKIADVEAQNFDSAKHAKDTATS